MRVAEIMTQAAITTSTGATLRSAAELMWRQQTGSLVVIDGDAVVGIVTERDVLRAVATGIDVETPVGEVMTKNVVTTSPDVPVRDAARQMAQHWIRHLPVIDESGALVGNLSQRDITGVFAALWREGGVPEIDTDDLVRARRLARIERGDLD